MDFRSEGTPVGSVNLSRFLLRILKAERCDFLGEIAPALEPFKIWIPLCPFIVRNSERRTQNPSKSLKKPLLRQKDDNLPQVRKFSVKLTLVFIHISGYIAMGEANSKNPVHLL